MTSHTFARAVFYTVAAGSILAGMDSLGKVLMREFSPYQVTWARFFFHTLLMFGFLAAQGEWAAFRTKAPKIQMLRGLCMAGINTSLYIAIITVSLAEATALMYLSPVLVTLLAGIFLGEKITPRHLLAVAAGFVGVLVIIRPGFHAFEPSMLLVLLASFLLAFYFLLTRKVSSIDGGRTSLFYTALVGAVVLSIIVAVHGWIAPTPTQWLLLACMGALGMSGHFLFIKAYTLQPASELSPWLNAQVVAATLFSVFLFGDVLDGWFYLGTGLIVGAGLLVWIGGRRKSTI